MRAAWIVVGLTALALPCRGAERGKPIAPPASTVVNVPKCVTGVPGGTLEGPFVFRNVALYTVRGATGDGTDYITLDEGLAKRVVAVREQGGGDGSGPRVNLLDVRNMSSRWLYIQAGDIVKGGKQDRTVATDLSLAPRSAAPAVEAFCVEHGRWTSGDSFVQNTALVSGNALKLSIQLEGNQTRVWDEVARLEQIVVKGGEDVYLPLIPLDLASGFWTGKGGVPTRPAAAPPPAPAQGLSSTGTYNAILENRAIRDACREYVKVLEAPLKKDREVIGVVVAVNGKIRAADLYGSNVLFGKMSRKLLDSYVLEATLNRNAASTAAPSPGEVVAFLEESAREGSRTAKVLAGTVNRQTRENATSVLFEYSLAGGGERATGVFHRNYLAK